MGGAVVRTLALELAAFRCSAGAGYITGAAIPVGGGGLLNAVAMAGE